MKVKLGSEEIFLDPDILTFNEATLNQFLTKYASLYNYFMEKHAEAQYVNSRYQDKYDAVSAEKFTTFKDIGGSDKFCEAKVASDAQVQTALEMVRTSKHTVNLLWGYLRAMDRAHEDAINLGYNIRKELSSIFSSTIKKVDDKISGN